MIRALFALALLALFAPAHAAEDQGRFVEIAAAPSKNIAPPRVTIWLPPGYDKGRARYPVVYMHDNQNLFFVERSNQKKVWAADKAALRLIAAGTVKPFIIVGIDNPGRNRQRQYMPQRVHADVAAPTRAALEAFAGGPMTSDAYLAFIVKELKPLIDGAYRTRPDRARTAIAGSSMGGLISFYAITQFPDVFGRAACVSTHWPMGNPVAAVEPIPDIVAAWDRYVKGTVGAPNGRRIWFDHGTKTLDYYYPPYQQAIDAGLTAQGWRKGRDFESRVYPDAAHEENAWAARMDDVFGWLMR
jgi:pimeloyl-ACP methyl ester carboxylesterase